MIDRNSKISRQLYFYKILDVFFDWERWVYEKDLSGKKTQILSCNTEILFEEVLIYLIENL